MLIIVSIFGYATPCTRLVVQRYAITFFCHTAFQYFSLLSQSQLFLNLSIYLYISLSLCWTTEARQKTNMPLCFQFDLLPGYLDVRMCPCISQEWLDETYNYIMYAQCTLYIIRLSPMRGLRWCALFVISTYISCVIGVNIRRMAKNGNLQIQIYEASIIRYLWHEVLNKTVNFVKFQTLKY